MRQDPTTLEDTWLTRAKRLLALAETGQHFTKDPFDRERYDEIASMAQAMLADLGRVPVSRIEGLISDHAGGYATPSIDIRGAVIRGGSILLVRERLDGLWAMPGGFADIGSSPAEDIEREVWEEAGLRVRAQHLFALRHKARHPYPPDARDFNKLFFLCDEDGTDTPQWGAETSDAAFFSLDKLPELSLVRNIHADVTAAFQAHSMGQPQTHFD
ncbi:NTP pyrophosphohydrolases containing a Zn-finger, probably nucleic-acid-binding [Ruegeria denitrificans]|uniref:NTP pyrophosphohydrolases containing a Zn-finger, probably nucleic-acid-binding n=1 Tax=Ruegeria denitrificans TaxID=1715692 RepID=A0A0N7M9Y7_9RHOB|nr:NUDIX hydrolase N-terminal domain-containing protein [Ruegeria denitrificans]CUK05188.1 NTP pyrophosphohydrolases containing a Zn-finger, probably nucleic-acid-binding [Ruegeria denitrificans]